MEGKNIIEKTLKVIAIPPLSKFVIKFLKFASEQFSNKQSLYRKKLKLILIEINAEGQYVYVYKCADCYSASHIA